MRRATAYTAADFNRAKYGPREHGLAKCLAAIAAVTVVLILVLRAVGAGAPAGASGAYDSWKHAVPQTGYTSGGTNS